MRRGHPGIGGWRNENQRHFRPRSGVSPRLRPPRVYSLLDAPRFPPPGTGSHRGQNSYNTHSGHSEEHDQSDHHERTHYRNQSHHQNNPRQQDRGHHHRSRQAYSYTHSNLNQEDRIQSSPYKHSSNFYKDVPVDPYHVNNMGDVDHRQHNTIPHSQDSYGSHRINPWANPPPDQRRHYVDRSPQKYYRHYDLERPGLDGNKIPSLDYTGHRPPSSDYYGSTSTTIVNNNDTSFSRSVDDTVDLVRKRLMSRSDPQTLSQDVIHNQNITQEVVENISQHTQQEQPTKKRIQRQRQNVKSNCDKMKTNIVHQLFKMDKDKIHKLMDNPSSSSKFEYAISSLITESQNSLNRHLRSVAEKSLVSSSSDFIHHDNNTIYEDTFMKQMQCLLDPQDTVLLEDIKPLVMAELSKVLQIDDFETRYDPDDQIAHYTRDDNVPVRADHQNYPHYENYNYEDYPQEMFYDIEPRPSSNFEEQQGSDVIDTAIQNSSFNNKIVKTVDNYNPATLFERRSSRKSEHDQDRRQSTESQKQRQSIDKTIEEIYNMNEEMLPLFSTNTEQFSEEEEDTFAELDRQYHVAVDHNFLDDDSSRASPNNVKPIGLNPAHLKKEIDNQLQPYTEAPLSLFSTTDKDDRAGSGRNVIEIKQETLQSPDFPKENSTPANSDNIAQKIDDVKVKQEPRSKEPENKKSGTENSSISKTSQSNSRKRSIDQRPSHRKEKRKKSESSSSDISKSSLNKQKSSSHDNQSKSTDKCNEATKAYYSIFSSKDSNSGSSRDNKRNDTTEKSYSDKYVKRKESRKSKDRDREPHKKRSSSSSSQTILSPKDTSNISVTPTKSDSKTKLKTIDMFVEQPKIVSVHHAHRNTASTPVVTPKPNEDTKTKIVTTPTRKTVQTKNASTQVIKRVINKETQTLETKSDVISRHSQTTETTDIVPKDVQTPNMILDKLDSKTKSSFERMKEIDMLIQVLLHEKFTLYHNLDIKDSCPSSVSMTVVNVTPMDDNENEPMRIQEVVTTSNAESNTVLVVPDSSIKLISNSVENSECIINLDSFTNPDIRPQLEIIEISDTDKKPDLNSNIQDPDIIVDDFTSMPVEELEKIALGSVEVEDVNFAEIKMDKRTARQKALQQERLKSASPQSSTSSRKSSKKRKTPNISLIEQIITDERPLEDIISLDDFETPTPKNKTKLQRTKPKKKVSKKSKPSKNIDVGPYDLKECSVVLIPTDISKYMKESPVRYEEVIKVESVDSCESFHESPDPYQDALGPVQESYKRPGRREIVEESGVNDLQFDMLDVSEDIVIGDSCEIKDKDSNEQVVTISEDLILDNSQSSADDVFAAEPVQAENECKTYDFSTDEDLRRDSLTVTGNADAVLAIECIENNFVAACLDGSVYHFSGDGQLLNTMRGSNLAVTCLTIVKEKYGTTVYTGSLDSRIRYYDLETGLEKGPECNVLSPIQTMDRAWDTVFVGTRTGFVLQFECKNNMLIPVSTVKFSEQAILALRAMKEGPRKVLLVASRSENVTIKDAQTGLLLRTLMGPKMTVYTLLFEDGKVYCGTSSHQIHVFDYASGSHSGCHSGGKGAVCLRAAGGLLFAGCYDGCVYVYREGEARPLAQLRGPGLMLLSLAILGTKIIAGYKDRSLYIWKIPLSILQEMIL